MSRPTREESLMQIATVISLRSTCDRKLVGAVIAIDGRPVSWGYNGAPPGIEHCDENDHGWNGMFGDPESMGCRNTTHAEANAIAFAARQGISTANASLFVTVSPCDACSRLVVAAGIKDVWYKEAYRDPAGLELLERAGVKCYVLDGRL